MKVILDKTDTKIVCIENVRNQRDDLIIHMVTVTANQKLKANPNFNIAKYIKDNLE